MAVPQLYSKDQEDPRGFGEYIRLLYLDNKIEFEDLRYNIGGEEWPEVKKKMIFGQMPALKYDGNEIAQTGAIMHLNGSNEEEATFLDMFFEGVRDSRMKYLRFVYFNEETRENHVQKTLPEHLANFEKLFKIHSGDYIIGNKTNYTDYSLFEELDVYHTLDALILDKFPALKAFWERMWKRPNLKSYLEKRAADKI
ncbi:hypothetical protein GCK72_020026 [Caenorhabditis remanei]|uniref:glutathione transferase n=1 Tax=Caenorhabditis remanei TaxID=31234 RepID=A0A6A5GGD4_CAERE|nr:hypothetical protein GCK72_020026 [Caenorhabditis remanei]KAF1753469.1 hypothetical protein GCK72_020026 [Caenorhabditis remanei]